MGLVAGDEASTEGRFKRWSLAVSGAPHSVEARGLYAGPRWQASLRIADAADGRGREVDLFVASAGLGLIRADRRVPSYSATFSCGSEDSVVAAGSSARQRRDATRRWWAMLARGESPLRGLSEEYNRVVVVLSPDYLDAVSDDLADAVELGRQRVVIFGSGRPPRGGLEPSWVRVGRHLRETTEARTEPLINGLDATLLQSTASLIVSRPLHEWSSAEKIQKYLDHRADPNVITLEARARAQRRPSTDEEIRAFVRGRLVVADESSSDLLNVWRTVEKRQCEERRFKQIFAKVVGDGVRGG